MRRRPAAYLAILAIALQAFWPLLAQAKPKNVVLVPVCTVQGVTHYIELPSSGTPVEQKAATQHDHCSFCSFGGERTGVAGVVSVAAAPQGSHESPGTAEDSLPESQKTFHARPRAPPASD